MWGLFRFIECVIARWNKFIILMIELFLISKYARFKLQGNAKLLRMRVASAINKINPLKKVN